LRLITSACASAALAAAAGAFAQGTGADTQLARDILRELVEVRTVHPDGDNTAAARAVERRLRAAGFDPADVQVLEPAPRKGNLVARLRGTGEGRPMLLLAHIDVVDAKKEDWSPGLDPWKVTERDGFLYGRGVLDDKAAAAIFAASLIRLKREGRPLKRDVILALTADEEGGTHNGVQWLLERHRALIDAEYAINEGGDALFAAGKPYLRVQVGEKMYLSFALEATNKGGHSSLPERDNAIYDLAAALERLSRMELPARVSHVTRAFAAAAADQETGAMSQALRAIAAGSPSAEDLRLASTSASYNAQLRTTCVATRIEGGHADNALPQRALATVNCRLLPGEQEAFVRAELEKAAGPRIKVAPKNPLFASPESDPHSPVMGIIEREAREVWPGAHVAPAMSAGATDGSRLRNAGIPVYGVQPMFMAEADWKRMHGRDERIPIQGFQGALEYFGRLIPTLASAP
jgi:acetylornithine deacetylase/succinyl-diaminopimelate desuccinylase-like protein